MLRLGISEDEKMTLGNEKIYLSDSFIYIGSIVSKDGGCIEDVKSTIPNRIVRVFFHS